MIANVAKNRKCKVGSEPEFGVKKTALEQKNFD
jgi:hypothetical protein